MDILKIQRKYRGQRGKIEMIDMSGQCRIEFSDGELLWFHYTELDQ